MGLCGSFRCGCGVTSSPAVSGAINGNLPTIVVAGSGESGDPYNLSLNNAWATEVAGALNAIAGNWITYTATLTNITAGTGATRVDRYLRFGPSGKTAIVHNLITLGTGGTLTGWGLFSTPFTLASGSRILGQGNMAQASPAQNFPALVYGNGLSQAGPGCIGTGAAFATLNFSGATIPFTWTVGDTLSQMYLAELA